MTSQISELMDGELADEQAHLLFSALAKDESAKQAWSTYHVIGDALRAEYGHNVRLQERILSALDSEPVVLAPGAAAAVKGARNRFQPAQRVMFAAAAAIAAFGVVTWLSEPQQADVTPRVAVAPRPALTATTPAGGVQQAGFSFDEYLDAHREFTPILPGIQRAALDQPAEAGALEWKR